MRCFTVNWDEKTEEAKISYADWFKPDAISGTQIVVLDALHDAIIELTELYNKTLETKPMKEKA